MEVHTSANDKTAERIENSAWNRKEYYDKNYKQTQPVDATTKNTMQQIKSQNDRQKTSSTAVFHKKNSKAHRWFLTTYPENSCP